MPDRAHNNDLAAAETGLDLELRLALSLVETKELKLRRAIQLVSEAQRELLAARRELSGVRRRIDPNHRSALLPDPRPRRTSA